MKSYFNFTKRQKIGIITIAIIIVLQIVLLNLNQIRTVPNPILVDDDKYEIISKIDLYQPNDISKKPKKSKQKISYKPFNPNDYSENQWKNIGFSSKQASTIVKYKNSINGFKSKNDVKKIYVISDEKYKEIEPFLVFNQSKIIKNDFKNDKYFDTLNKTSQLTIKAEINSATLEDLKNIVGIGEYTAKNILMRRVALGGFHSIDQLNEVNGVYGDNIELIKQQLFVDTTKIKKLNANELSIPQLKKHPYISWNVAQAITNERLKGNLNNLQFLVDEKKLLTQKELTNLIPYIKF
jgi:DNA uptake protein ComE-like DNA-binding protein